MVSQSHVRFNYVGYYDLDTQSYQYYKCFFATMGNVHSIYMWCRVASFVNYLLVTLFDMCSRCYIDDIFCVEPSESSLDAMEYALQLLLLMGYFQTFGRKVAPRSVS